VPRKVIGRDGDRVLVDLDEEQHGVPLGAVVLDDGRVSPALPVDAFDAAGLYDQEEPDPSGVVRRVGNPPPGLP
jgi:hypothetical protein